MSHPNDSGSLHCTQPCIGRRAFVERSIGAVLGTSLLTACASLVTRTVTPIDGTLRLALVHYPELAADGGSLKVIPKGSKDPIYVLALGDRRYAALSPICTHLGCTPDWKASENKFKCPCHGSGYDSEGINFEGPAPRPMDRAKVQLDAEGQVVVDVGTLYEWPKGEKSEFDDDGAFIRV